MILIGYYFDTKSVLFLLDPSFPEMLGTRFKASCLRISPGQLTSAADCIQLFSELFIG